MISAKRHFTHYFLGKMILQSSKYPSCISGGKYPKKETSFKCHISKNLLEGEWKGKYLVI